MSVQLYAIPHSYSVQLPNEQTGLEGKLAAVILHLFHDNIYVVVVTVTLIMFKQQGHVVEK